MSLASEDRSGTASDNSAFYTSDGAGHRSTVIYTKNSSETARYGYTDYLAVGDPASPSRVFQNDCQARHVEQPDERGIPLRLRWQRKAARLDLRPDAGFGLYALDGRFLV